mgnify:CR=1 FL=1|tara:strand:+ start:2447 stop:2773 length:327 start_codon:yes stop_codon:yes gene_type:complete
MTASRTEAIRHILATLFAAQGALKALASEFNWAGMGNLLGDYGEFICIEAYGLEKAPAGSSGYDAITKDGLTVQMNKFKASTQVEPRRSTDYSLMKILEVGIGSKYNN